MTYYKVLNEDGSAFHGGTGKWHLPKGRRPGKWMEPIPDPVPCQRGYHVCEPGDLLKWLGPAIWVVETRGTSVRDTNKTVFEQARLVAPTAWNERTARLFAVDCAARALNREKRAGRPPDKRSYDALKVARRFASGEATTEELLAAAWAAAWAAARDAAQDAAWAAARDAAQDAAWAAARAAWAAARAADRRWQTKRLLEYLEGKRG